MGGATKSTRKRVEVADLYAVDGSKTTHHPANGKKFTWEELVKLLGGWLESCIGTTQYAATYVDEEGRLKGLLPNPRTWELLKRDVYALNGYAESWRVSGPILVVRKEDAA